MKRIWRRCGLAAALLAASWSRAREADTRAPFAWRQPIRGDIRPGDRFRVRVTDDIYDGCDDPLLADLRVFDTEGRPWPRLIWRDPSALVTTRVLAARQLNVSTAMPSGEVRLDADLSVDASRRPPIHNAVRIVLRGDEWIRPVTVLGRDDADTWMTLAAGHVLRLRHEGGLVQSDRVGYPPSDLRRLQVRVGSDPRRPEAAVIERIEVLADVLPAPDAPFERVEWTAIAPPAERPQWQSLLFDTRVRGGPLNRIEIEADGEYARPVTIWVAPHPTGTWIHIASDQIHRIGMDQRARLDVFGRGRYWRLDVFRGEDPPLANVRARAFRQIAWWVIEAVADGPAALYYGAASLTAPQHDLARRLRPEEIGALPVRELGPREPNPLCRPGIAPAWSRWAALAAVGAAAIAVAWVIARLLRVPPHAAGP